jgi:hypothetical protein
MQAMVNPFKKIQCPYCSVEMQLRDCKIVSRVDPGKTVLYDPTQKRTLQRTFLAPSTTGREFTRHLASRVCPNPQCDRELPRNIDTVDQNITIAVIGDTFSGKSHYIAVAIDQLRSGKYIPRGYDLCLLNPADDEVEEMYQRDYYQPLFQQNLVLPRSNRATGTDADPLIYELTLDGQTRKLVNLLIYDVSGEDLVSQRDFMTYRPHLLNAKALLFMADPWAIPGFRSKLAHHLQPDPSQVTGRVATTVLSSAMRLYQSYVGRTGKARFTMPVAVALSKADLIPYLTVDPYYHDLFNPDYEEHMDIDSDSPVNNAIQHLLKTLNEHSLVTMTQKLEHARLFAVSATGSNPDINTGEFTTIKPYRCLDPLFWILREMRVFY